MSAPTVQPDHSRALWDSMLDAEMNVLYWTFKCAREQFWVRSLKIIVLATASGTAFASLSIWTRLPLVWQVVSVSAFIASVVNQVCFPAQRLVKLSGLIATWKELSIDYGLLWERDRYLTGNPAWDSYEAIKRRERAIDESEFPHLNRKLREKAFQQVCRKRGLL